MSRALRIVPRPGRTLSGIHSRSSRAPVIKMIDPTLSPVSSLTPVWNTSQGAAPSLARISNVIPKPKRKRPKTQRVSFLDQVAKFVSANRSSIVANRLPGREGRLANLTNWRELPGDGGVFGSLVQVLDRLTSLEQEYIELEQRLGDPTITADNKRFVEMSRRYAALGDIVRLARSLREKHDDVETIKMLLSEASAEEKDELRAESNSLDQEIAELESELKILLLPKDPNEGRNVIIEIRGAEGGEEANLFARDLFEMYEAYASTLGWSMETMNATASDMGGLQEVTFMLKGDGVWTRMKFEAGPHRVQRVPVTESQGRVHTSSATVTVLPEAEEIDVKIDPADLQVDVFRASGAGGQHVNKTESAVRMTHKPTGIVVSMQDEKSQLQNRERALKVLRSRILQQEEEQRREEASNARRDQTGSGGRSEKIRTYNFKENRVTDHRIGLTLHKLEKVLAGELEDVSDALVQEERARQLASSEDG